MPLELGVVTDGEGNELYDTAVIYFTGEDDESQIEVQAPNAPEIARNIIKLWNDALVEHRLNKHKTQEAQ